MGFAFGVWPLPFCIWRLALAFESAPPSPAHPPTECLLEALLLLGSQHLADLLAQVLLLAIELLLFEFSRRALVPLVVACAVAGGVHAALFGDGAFFEVPNHRFAGLGTLPIFAVLGIFAGLAAVLIAKGLFVIEHAYRKLPVDEFWHPVIGAVLFATVKCSETWCPSTRSPHVLFGVGVPKMVKK